MKILLQIFLTPISTCICERSLSNLRRIKTYLRADISAKNLHKFAVLHIHKTVTEALNLDAVINEWINRNVHSKSTSVIML